MTFQLRFFCVFLVTDLAFKWPLASMRVYMGIQVKPLRGPLATNLPGERAFSCMKAVKRNEINLLGESFAKVFALVGFLADVSKHVVLAMRSAGK